MIGKNNWVACRDPKCNNMAIHAKLCMRHGASTTRRSHPECNSIAAKGEASQKQTTKKRKCRFPSCTNVSQKWGVCRRHGAEPTKCNQADCTNRAVKGGVCRYHGATAKKCSHTNCTNQSSKGGVCRRHGAGGTKCSEPNCGNYAKRSGLCRRHGAYKTNGNPNRHRRDFSEGSCQISLTTSKKEVEDEKVVNISCGDCNTEKTLVQENPTNCRNSSKDDETPQISKKDIEDEQFMKILCGDCYNDEETPFSPNAASHIPPLSLAPVTYRPVELHDDLLSRTRDVEKELLKFYDENIMVDSFCDF